MPTPWLDPTRPDLVHIKVGRTNDVRRCLYEHCRRCPTSKYKLLGHYPQVISRTTPSSVPYCDRLERLVHVELTDISARSHPPSRTAHRGRCTDCEHHLYHSLQPPSFTLLQAVLCTVRYSHLLDCAVRTRAVSGIGSFGPLSSAGPATCQCFEYQSPRQPYAGVQVSLYICILLLLLL